VEQRRRPLHIQLWSYNYEPEPTGIGPVSSVWAREMRDRGHQVEVVAAHPHYPAPIWGRTLIPTREERGGIPVLRLPLWSGRATSAQRVRQELTFTASQTLALGALSTPDVIVAVSPSFPALLPAMLNARIRKRPWVLWLQDILPDAAIATGLLNGGPIFRLAQRLETAAYKSAERIVVISETFQENLLHKTVPEEKLTRIYNPATRRLGGPRAERIEHESAPRALAMGNIGHSQGLPELVRAFERSKEAASCGLRLVITGEGVAAGDVRRAITTDRVEMLGLVSEERLEAELRRATIGVVSQRSTHRDFNVPSKLMNLMAYGIPVVASVRLDSEAARIIHESGAGWVTDSSDPQEFVTATVSAARDRSAREQRGAAGWEFAERQFTPARACEQFERVLLEATRTNRISKDDAAFARAVNRPNDVEASS
jgi:putative colanic acid biosynthesis glycosyltransferase WcaI